MGVKADITGRLRNKLALQHPLAPVTDLTTQLQLSLSQDRQTGTSTPLYDGTDVQDQLDVYLDALTSASSWTTT